ncbi:MAG: FAD binding domain-containing protein [Capsulimonadaceae bacterium]
MKNKGAGMKAFAIVHPTTVSEAVHELRQDGAHAIGGGQDLLGLMKDYIVSPDRVVDLKRIPGLASIEADSRGLRIGALATLTDIAEHPAIRAGYPAVAESAASVGSVQIRNAGTIGGNLCQRPRCWYFRNEHARCLKKGGSHCYAADDDGENKYHAIFGDGPCHIVHPSDMAPALVCLGAVAHAAGPAGRRDIPISEMFVLPQDGGITHETVLRVGEMVTGITVPPSALASRSIYLKLRERESFDWSLASAAVAVTLSGGVVREASIVLGGVAPTPWRAGAAEAALRGRPLTPSTIEAASSAVAQGAAPLPHNEYKVVLAQVIARRALMVVARGDRVAYAGMEETAWTV